MEFGVYEQTFSFLASAFLGFFLGIIYDFFKCIKKNLRVNKIENNIVDIVFLLSSFAFFFFIMFRLNGFNLRIYHILGTFIGIILYFSTLSVLVSRFFIFFLNFFEKILKILLYPMKFLCKIINRVFTFIKGIFRYILKFLKRLLNIPIRSFKSILKRRKKI